MHVEIAREGATAVVRFANGPVNALSVGQGLVGALMAALSELESAPDVASIILSGKGRMFCGGADIRDFDADPIQVEALRDLLAMVEACAKPVIVALHGAALGGGLELALASHFRIAQSGARLGLPEVSLGLLPGAGGTQRLPRLAGAAQAIAMMLSGKPIDARRAWELGIVDELVEGDPLQAARALAAHGVAPRRTGELAPPADLDQAVAAARASLADSRNPAPAFILDCVSVVAGGFETGLKVEAGLFARLMASPTSVALRHAFFAERAVARIPDMTPNVRPRQIGSVGVVGGGAMGTGIAIALLGAGWSVILVEPRAEAREAAARKIVATIRRDAKKGRITAELAEKRVSALTTAGDLAAVAPADLVIEAVFEDMAVKSDILCKLEGIVAPETILASNTSTLDLDKLAGAVSDPSRVVGLHFFSPANIMRLLEVVRTKHVAPDVLVTALNIGKRMGKVSVVSGVCDGFIGNRMFEEYLRQVWYMLEEGALPEQIDGALERWGMAMGPCRTMDLVGQDIGWAIRRRRVVEQPDRPYSSVIDKICELGRFGQKTGAGLYIYPEESGAKPDPDVERLIIAHSAEAGIVRRAIPDGEIVTRCLLALINEGARILGEGIAYRPLDIDMTWLHGYGFPRDRGGPMFEADQRGLATVLSDLRALSGGRQGWAWTPAPLIEQLAASGDGFASLNSAPGRE